MNTIKNYKNLFTGKADLEDINIIYDIIFILPIMMIGLSFYYNTPYEILIGLKDIILANDVFLTDYIQVTSMGAALFNSGFITLIISHFLKKLDLKPNGLIFAAIFITAGFTFIGKNFYNIWPFYIGGYIYSRVKKMDFKHVVVTSIFTASLAPVVSVTTFLCHNTYQAITLGYLAGIIIGYIMPSISKQLLLAHAGYTLYNTGFAAGFVGAICNSIAKNFGYNVSGIDIHNTEKYRAVIALFIIYFLILIYIGYVHNDKSFKNYPKITNYTGRLVTDFHRLVGLPITIMNMGIMGLISLFYITLLNGVLCGSNIAGMLTIVGFSTFGKHPKNSIPLMVGVFIGALLIKVDINIATIITIGLFSTSLAPIAGEYGFLVGIFVGIAHLFVTLNTSSWHSGMNLYNNGFSSGIVAMLAIPILNSLSVPKKHSEIKE